MKLTLPFRRRGTTTRGRAATRSTISGVSLAVVASTLVVLAFNAEGTPISDVDLNDGSVWVTNSQPGYQLLGRLNPQIQQLDLGIQSMSGDFDVFQDGTTVFLDVRSGGRGLRQIDVAAGVAQDPISFTPTTSVAYAGDTFGIVDRETGAAWVRSTMSLQGFAQDQTEPDLKVGRDASVTVGSDGSAHFFDVGRRKVTSVSIDDSGLPSVGDAQDLPAKFSDAVSATAVGSVPVLYDRESGQLMWPGLDTPLTVPTDDLTSVRLQQPSAADGPHDGALHVATREGLLAVDLEDGGVETLRDGMDGPPAAPVVHRGYVHAAWADPTADGYVRLHDDQAPHAEKIPGVVATAGLVFRVNRDVVVLNDVVSGVSWLVQQEGLPRVENWDDVHPAKQKRKTTDPEPDKLEKVRRTEENRKPTARPDTLGARPGADSLLPLTRNDIDLDGDILTIEEFKQTSGAKPESVPVVVGDGTMVQVRFGPNQAGKQATFSYTVADGRGGTADATATVTVVPDRDNRTPQVIRDGSTPRQTTMDVAKGQRAEAYVLQDWTDPDGDPLVLSDARLAKGGAVTFRPDGMVEFVDDGKTSGQKVIEVDVSDGHDGGTSTGKVIVNVSGRSSAPPLVVPDRAVGLVGTDILVEPLANDFSRDGTPLNLRSVAPQGGVEITPDSTAGTFVARTSRPGTYYLEYAAYTERGEAASFVRLDVLDTPEQNLPPVAMRDEALVPPGGHALVDLLANDSDPENDVLAVTEVTVDPTSGVKGALLENRMLRLEAARDLTAPVSVRYTVSDGINVAHGSVTVGQAQLRQENRPPVAQDDRITVRAGAVSSVSVLANDFDPDADTLQLFGQDLTAPEGLPLFVSGSKLRFRAPDEPGLLRATYGVRDARGQRDDAELLIDVIADDPEINSAPRPDPVQARAVGERPTRIDLSLATADPDGDAVSLKSLRTAPGLGRIVSTGLDWVEYQPYSNSRGGTDTFKVEVQDKYGALGLQTVQVGVVPRSSTNQPPVALDDRLQVRPGRTVQYNVLANDNDPDGDELAVADELTTSEGTSATVEDGFVTVEVPDSGDAAPQQYAAVYTVDDGAGSSDRARFTVTASPEAPLHSPITQDDAAALADVAGQEPGDTVRVDVLANDGDLDGRREEMKLSAYDTDISNVEDNQLDITLAAQDQVVVYEVRDADDNVSYGFVFVAGTDTVPPVIDPGAEPNPIEVEAGESVDIDLTHYVLVRAGREPLLTVADKVVSAPFTSAAKVKDSQMLTFTAPKDRYGTASVTFEVTDGTNLNDVTGLTSVLTLPVDVVPPEGTNVAPEMRDIDVLLVVGDEAEEKRIDLAPHATDANPDDELTFAATGTDLVAARVEGNELVLNGADDVADGEVTAVKLRVEDSAGASAQAVANVRLVRSDKPLVTIGTIGPLEAEAGVPVTIDVNDHASNPYPDRNLTVSGGTRETGEGTVATSGSTITITPANDWSGTLTARFDVHDGSDDPARDVVGRVEVAVVAAPEAPGRPTATALTHDSVRVDWTPADDNGAPITSHVVAWDGGDKTCDAGTTCTVDGLSAGATYAFTVTAVNRVGEGAPSAASAPVTPDTVPEQITDFRISQDFTQRDKKLPLAWTPPENKGSKILHYEIQRHGQGGSGGEVKKEKGTSFTWPGLTNGSDEQFSIRAVNAEGPGPWTASTKEKPFGVPAQVSKASAVASANDGLPDGKVSINWTAPDNSGDTVTSYDVARYENGALQETKTVEAALSTEFAVSNGQRYTFTVTATNRAGASEASVKSDPVKPYDQATGFAAPTLVNEGDRKATIRFSEPANLGGLKVKEYRITSNGGPSRTVSSAGAHEVTFSSNNTFEVKVTPVTHDPEDGLVGEVVGDSGTLSNVKPFGKPLPPGASATPNGRSVTLGWSWPAENGREITKLETRIDGGGWVKRSVDDNKSARVGDGYSETHRIDVRVTDSEGQTTTHSASATSAPKPTPTMGISYESPSSDWIDVKLRNYTPNITVSIQCWVTPNSSGQGGRSIGSFTVSTDGDGHASTNRGCYLNGGGYGNLRIGPNELWSNTIALHP